MALAAMLTREEAAAATGHKDRVKVRDLFEKLKRAGSLSGHHQKVVKRRHEDSAFAFCDEACNLFAVFALAIIKDNLCPVAARRGNLGLRSIGRHDNSRARASLTRRQCYGLRVIAGREGRDAALSLFFGQRENAIGRPANLERACALKVLAFEEDATRPLGSAAHGFIKRARCDNGRAMNVRRNTPVRFSDILKHYH
jgi:hypothetical protein